MEEYICVNKELVKQYGSDLAIFLTAIYQTNSSDEYFECTMSSLEQLLGFSRRLQERILKTLTKLDILCVSVKGSPPKRYFKINYENLPECLKSRPPTQKPNEIAVLEKAKPEKPKPKTSKIQDEFDQLWQQYPNKQGKQKAFIAYQKAVKNGATFDEVMQGIQNYNFFIEQTRLEQQFVKHGSTWFNQHGWEDDYTIIEREPIKKKTRYETIDERNNRVFAEFLKDEDLSDLPQVYEDCLKGLTEGFHV